MRNGSLFGGLFGLIYSARQFIKAGGFSNLAKQSAEIILKEKNKIVSAPKTKLGIGMAIVILGGATIGAGVGAIVKHFTHKD